MKTQIKILVLVLMTLSLMIGVMIAVVGASFGASLYTTPTRPIDFEREWKITIIDSNEAMFTSKGDTVLVSIEDTGGLQELNPIAFVNK